MTTKYIGAQNPSGSGEPLLKIPKSLEFSQCDNKIRWNPIPFGVRGTLDQKIPIIWNLVNMTKHYIGIPNPTETGLRTFKLIPTIP
jgi:hypothetical protein